MANRSKGRGTRYETAIRSAINAYAGEGACERVALHGSRDHGDLRIRAGGLTLCGECKWRQRYPPESEMAAFREQTLAEAANAGADGGVLFVNRYRMEALRHECWMTHRTLGLLCGYGREMAPDRWACVTLAQFLRMAFGGDAA